MVIYLGDITDNKFPLSKLKSKVFSKRANILFNVMETFQGEEFYLRLNKPPSLNDLQDIRMKYINVVIEPGLQIKEGDPLLAIDYSISCKALILIDIHITQPFIRHDDTLMNFIKRFNPRIVMFGGLVNQILYEHFVKKCSFITLTSYSNIIIKEEDLHNVYMNIYSHNENSAKLLAYENMATKKRFTERELFNIVKPVNIKTAMNPC